MAGTGILGSIGNTSYCIWFQQLKTGRGGGQGMDDIKKEDKKKEAEEVEDNENGMDDETTG